jgi:drug/metabolite transporter (DMT)-like permease
MEASDRHVLSRPLALALFALVVFCWGGNWAVTKIVVHQVPPLWTTAIRCMIASVALLFILLIRGQFIVPKKGDIPVVLAVSLLHMVAFSTLVAYGLKFVPLGRSIVLGYTTPLWVVPGAFLFLKERLHRGQAIGIGLGLLGLLWMFNPGDFDFDDRNTVIGNGALLLAALCWAANIVYVRGHRWVSTPFQLVFWQTLLASLILTALAFWLDGPPHIDWSPRLAAAMLYGGIVGTALAYWAMAMINRSLPAATTSLGLLATPVVGVVCSAIGFAEPISPSLLISMTFILGGIFVGTVTGGTSRAVDFPERAISTQTRRTSRR